MAELSVIIPIYKVEAYLRQCVDSVINQQLNDLELILVDDGSPDKCPAICDEYQKTYNFVKVIHKTNGGLSSARNAGIQAATGRYLIFMDSDDWWNPEVDVNAMLQEVRQHPDTEMFLFTSLDYIEGEGFFKRKEHERLSSIRTDSVEHYYADLLANGNLEVHAATKILQREFVVKNKLFFVSGITAEDNEWMIRVLRVLKSVFVLGHPLYIYRVGRAGSITSTVGIRNLNDLFLIIRKSIDFYKDGGISEVRQYEMCFCAYLWFCALGMSNSLSVAEYQKIKFSFKETAIVCQYSNSPKTQMAYRVYKTFGLNTARFVLGAYLFIKHKANMNKKKQSAA